MRIREIAGVVQALKETPLLGGRWSGVSLTAG
jgi:hypothetical protein